MPPVAGVAGVTGGCVVVLAAGAGAVVAGVEFSAEDILHLPSQPDAKA